MDSKTISITTKVERASRKYLLAEPAGYMDGQNLYEFVTSNPLTRVDPFGLKGWTPVGGVTHDKFGGQIALPDDSKATVEAITGAKLDYGDGSSRSGGIVFQVTSKNGSCEKCHFIQFVREYLYDNNGKASHDIYQATTYRRYGEWYLDTSWIAPESVWYDTYGEHTSDKGRLGVYDAPGMTYDPKTTSKTGMEFQLFLVCDGKVKWKWTWRAEVSKDKQGKWSDLTYVPESGAAATDLGDFKDMKEFQMGYTDPEGKNAVPPYANPLK